MLNDVEYDIRAYTRNPFAALGFAIAWLVTFGQVGRLPWYLEDPEG